MDETLEDRLAALERALTEDDHDLSALAEAGSVADRVDTLETRTAELDDRVAELEAATQALRGYVGNVRAVNEEVRQRADRALEAVESADGSLSGTDAAGSAGDTRAGTDDVEEPMLELETGTDTSNTGDVGTRRRADRDPDRRTRRHSRDGRTCPLCDGDGRGAGDSILEGEDREGVTDGGLPGVDASDDESDPAFLDRIRTLL